MGEGGAGIPRPFDKDHNKEPLAAALEPQNLAKNDKSIELSYTPGRAGPGWQKSAALAASKKYF